MKTLRELYKIHAPSGREWKMMEYLCAKCEELGAQVAFDDFGNIYAVKGKSETYPCVVAHTDQVQRFRDIRFNAYITTDRRNVVGGHFEGDKFVREGLGADDKNGIWCALKLLESECVLKVAFFVQEEIGCIGSSHADMSFFEDCRFVLQADRRGGHDFINYVYEDMCSPEFLKDVNPSRWGFTCTNGMMTDVAELFSNGVGISCCNISCGYYEPHTCREWTNLPELQHALKFMRHIVRNCKKCYLCTSIYALDDFKDDFAETYKFI